MKNKLFSTLLFVSSLGAAANEQTVCTSENLQGSWSLESAIYTDLKGNVVGEIKDGQTLSRKLLVNGDVNFITWAPSSEVKVAALGSYVIKPGRYIETITVTTYPGILNKTFDFQCSLEAGKWIHAGQENDMQIREVWVKK